MAIQKKTNKNLLTVDHSKSEEGETKGFEISVFRSGTPIADITKEGKADIFDVLVGDYNMSPTMLNHTFNEMKAKGWTIERFTASYQNLLNTHIWNTPPKPASLLNFDTKVKFNTYIEIQHECGKYVAVYYKGIGEPLYIKKQEQNQYNFPLWDEKYRNKIKKHYIDPVTKERIDL